MITQVKCCFSELTRFRLNAIRLDKGVLNYDAIVILAATIRWFW